MYYTPDELALMLRLHVQTVHLLIRDGSMGGSVVNLGSDVRPRYRVPSSAVNSYLDENRVFAELGVKACSKHELRRKVGQTAQ